MIKKIASLFAVVGALFFATPALADIKYACECASVGEANGAHASCVPGTSGNSGNSSASPRDRFTDSEINALPAGSEVRLCEGGKWINWRLVLERPASYPANQPLVITSYAPPTGATGRPWLTSNTTNYTGHIQFNASHINTSDDKGYIIRGLKLQGTGSDTGSEAVGSYGILLVGRTSYVTVENNELLHYDIAINVADPYQTNHFTVRNNEIHHILNMGLLGGANNFLIERNNFHHINYTGSNGNHAIYTSYARVPGASNAVIRYNTLTDISTKILCAGPAVDGCTQYAPYSGADLNYCTGGNITLHGKFNSLIIEGNKITQTQARGGCYGISVTAAYFYCDNMSNPPTSCVNVYSPEYFRKVAIRSNLLANLGGISIGLDGAVNPVIENNTIVQTQTGIGHVGIAIPALGICGDFDTDPGSPGYQDECPAGAMIRNNTIYFTQAASGSVGISMHALRAGNGNRVHSNAVYLGSSNNSNSSCFRHGAAGTAIATNGFTHNACFQGTGRWSTTDSAGGGFANQAAAQVSFAANGISADPDLILPTSANSWTCKTNSGSQLINAGHPTLSSRLARDGYQANGARDIGACEFGSTP